jgi:hypothetical protein
MNASGPKNPFFTIPKLHQKELLKKKIFLLSSMLLICRVFIASERERQT